MDTGGNIYTMEIGKCLSFPAPESCFLGALLWAMRLGDAQLGSGCLWPCPFRNSPEGGVFHTGGFWGASLGRELEGSE